MARAETSERSPRELRQQDERLDRGWIVISAAIVLPFLVLLAVGAKLLFSGASRGETAELAPTRPEPASQVSGVHSELFEKPLAGERLKQAQQRELEHYAWVDRQRGIVRVPIGTAIELVAKEAKEQP